MFETMLLSRTERPPQIRKIEEIRFVNRRLELIEILTNQYNRISNEGEVAPEGCWLEIAKCHGRKHSFQVFYRSTEPIFDGKKRKYIGMKNSMKHQQASDAIERREFLHRLSLQIKGLHRGNKI